MARLTPGLELRAWFGVVAAPAAWATQLVLGFAVTEADCGPVGRRWGVAVDTWSAAAMGVALAVAVAGLLTALSVRRATSADVPPPESRRYFLGVVGTTISPLFACIIVMSGVGALLLDSCRPG